MKNFRSINDVQTISFASTGLKSAEKYSEIDRNNITVDGGNHLFKTLGIYGANASGKTNIIKALDYFVKVVTKEASSESGMNSISDPFYFQEDFQFTESFFQIVLILNEKKYRYGLTVKKNLADSLERTGDKSNAEIVTSEWLFGPKEKNIVELFTRKHQNVKNDRLPNKEKIPELPYKHTLYLTHAAAFDKDGACQSIRDYLRAFVVSNLDSDHERFRWLSISHLRKDGEKRKFLELLSSFNLNYDDIIVQEDEDSLKKDIFPQNKISFSKNYSSQSGAKEERSLNLSKNESSGTQKLFDLTGLLLRAFSLKQPAFIILDEIDRNFHPYLLIGFIKLFNDPAVNKSSSQLLFTSHDTNLMDPGIMRRDQFYLTEKNDDNSTRLYSLADLKGVRNDADFAKQYLAGYYGALPILSNYITGNNEANE